VTFRTESGVVALANSTEMGLGSYVFSADLARALRVAESIDAGMVGINTRAFSDPAAPFGGTRQSGIGREGGHPRNSGVPRDQIHCGAVVMLAVPVAAS
jgi:succinate-semialdehyde dehydrogenase/glutarate-semialdehyde dehydrogenase